MEALEIMRISKQVAQQYRKRGSWWLDTDEAAQEAASHILKAMPRFDPTLGDEAGYAWRIAVIAIKKFCWRESSPVSGNIEKMRGVFRKSIIYAEVLDRGAAIEMGLGVGQRDQITERSEDYTPEETTDGPDAVLTEAEWRQRVRSALGVELAGMELGELAAQIIAGNATTAEVGAATGIPVKELYRLTERATNKLARSRTLWDLFLECK